eukprot:m.68065 g.68065  ORF g.68065 m.68065 type:complete len:89 (-) comp23906_c0_seq5:34-300(-)
MQGHDPDCVLESGVSFSTPFLTGHGPGDPFEAAWSAVPVLPGNGQLLHCCSSGSGVEAYIQALMGVGLRRTRRTLLSKASTFTNRVRV